MDNQKALLLIKDTLREGLIILKCVDSIGKGKVKKIGILLNLKHNGLNIRQELRQIAREGLSLLKSWEKWWESQSRKNYKQQLSRMWLTFKI